MLYRLVRNAEINRARFALLACHDKNVREPAAFFLVVRSNQPLRLTKTGLAKVYAASPRSGGYPCRYDDPNARFATEPEASARFEAGCLHRLTQTWNGVGR